jgi:hypothetical protein
MSGMKTHGIVALLIVMALAGFSETRAQQKGFGLGVMAGEPTGISFKAWLPGSSALDAGAAWSYFDEPSFHFHVDYLWHKFNLIPVGYGELPLYFGVGNRLKVHGYDDKAEFGFRAPVGIAYIFADGQFDTFTELVPIMDVYPATGIDFNAAIGIRYFFR